MRLHAQRACIHAGAWPCHISPRLSCCMHPLSPPPNRHSATHHPHKHDTIISNVPRLRTKASSGDPPPPPCPPPAAQLGTPPVTSCLWGYYTGDSYDSTSSQWNDLSGNGRHAAVTRGGAGLSVGSTTRGSATFSYLQGGPSDGFRFATNFSAAAPYTFIHITRWVLQGRSWRAADADARAGTDEWRLLRAKGAHLPLRSGMACCCHCCWHCHTCHHCHHCCPRCWLGDPALTPPAGTTSVRGSASGMAAGLSTGCPASMAA